MILGPGGAGKTTVANELAERTGLPVVHLDRIFWREGWTPAPRQEAERELERVVEADRWILDGNFLFGSEHPDFPSRAPTRSSSSTYRGASASGES